MDLHIRTGRRLTDVRRLNRQSGVTYLAMLFFVAMSGILLSGTGATWSTMQHREKEKELLYIGGEFRKAIASYYERSPGSVKKYPAKLDDLLIDNRFVYTLRHLRRIHRDPFTGHAEWGIVRADDGGIKGVYSLSSATPLKKAGFELSEADFEEAKSYAAWRFVYEPRTEFAVTNQSASSEKQK